MWCMARAKGTLSKAAQELGRRGGKARAKALPKKRRIEIAKTAIAVRWARARQKQPKKSK